LTYFNAIKRHGNFEGVLGSSLFLHCLLLRLRLLDVFEVKHQRAVLQESRKGVQGSACTGKTSLQNRTVTVSFSISKDVYGIPTTPVRGRMLLRSSMVCGLNFAVCHL